MSLWTTAAGSATRPPTLAPFTRGFRGTTAPCLSLWPGPWPLATPVSAGQLDVRETPVRLLQLLLQHHHAAACFHGGGADHSPHHSLAAGRLALGFGGFWHALASGYECLNFIEITCSLDPKVGPMAIPEPLRALACGASSAFGMPPKSPALQRRAGTPPVTPEVGGPLTVQVTGQACQRAIPPKE
jgi:hypothetical protein